MSFEERGQRSISVSISADTLLMTLLVPRGALRMWIEAVSGSYTFTTQSNASWHSILALVRGIKDLPNLVATLAGFDVLHSTLAGNADLGTPTGTTQINSWPFNRDFKQKQTVVRSKQPNIGFQLMYINEDVGVTVIITVTVRYVIVWPDEKATQIKDRTARMAIMNHQSGL